MQKTSFCSKPLNIIDCLLRALLVHHRHMSLKVQHMLFCIRLHWVARQSLCSVFLIIVKYFFKILYTSSWKSFPVCNKRQFGFLKLHLLVYSAGNPTVKCEADILVTEPLPCCNRSITQSSLASAIYFFFTVRMLIAVAESYTK